MRDQRTAILAFLLVAVAAMSQAADIFLSALDEAAARAEAAARRPLVERARADVNAFAEYAWLDASGAKLKQARHHHVFQELAQRHDLLVMWFPVEHGKSTQARILATWLLGRFPNRQYAIIKNTAEQAQKDVKAVGRTIVENPFVHHVFPELRPARGDVHAGTDTWGAKGIRVHGCPPGIPDPSLAAYGIGGDILGARLHGAIVDNVLDKKNTQSPLQRAKILEHIEQEVLSRIVDGGFCIVIDTAWHVDDALHVLAKRKRWHSEKFDAEQGLAGDETLWPAQWPAERLLRAKESRSIIAYNRMYRNMPLSETTAYFKEDAWVRSTSRTAWLDYWPSGGAAGVQLVTGVDLATKAKETADLTAFVTVSSDGTRRRLHNVQADHLVAGDILGRMVAIYRALHAPVQAAGGSARFVVEDNAAQTYIVDLMRVPEITRGLGLSEDEANRIQVVGRTTTAHKRDPELGVQALATDFEMDRWDVPDPEASAEMVELREEMRTWTPDTGHYGDRLMAMWIASSALGLGRLEMGRGSGQLSSYGGGAA